ncbi:MAG: hypothetical protein WEE89_03160 [Gemmatimonadota bacterium]
MKAIRWLVLASFLLPAVVSAQGRSRPGAGRGALQGPPPQRAVLEAQVFDRFVGKVSTDMKLDQPRQQRLKQHLQQSGQQRRQLTQQTVQLRRQLMRAARDSTVTEAEVEGLLTQFEQLRAREQDLWSRDNAALSQILTPRERAIFVLEFMRFNERIRDLVQQRTEPPSGR